MKNLLIKIIVICYLEERWRKELAEQIFLGEFFQTFSNSCFKKKLKVYRKAPEL
jgi:hypothetical protein